MVENYCTLCNAINIRLKQSNTKITGHVNFKAQLALIIAASLGFKQNLSRRNYISLLQQY